MLFQTICVALNVIFFVGTKTDVTTGQVEIKAGRRSTVGHKYGRQKEILPKQKPSYNVAHGLINSENRKDLGSKPIVLRHQRGLYFDHQRPSFDKSRFQNVRKAQHPNLPHNIGFNKFQKPLQYGIHSFSLRPNYKPVHGPNLLSNPRPVSSEPNFVEIDSFNHGINQPIIHGVHETTNKIPVLLLHKVQVPVSYKTSLHGFPESLPQGVQATSSRGIPAFATLGISGTSLNGVYRPNYRSKFQEIHGITGIHRPVVLDGSNISGIRVYQPGPSVTPHYGISPERNFECRNNIKKFNQGSTLNYGSDFPRENLHEQNFELFDQVGTSHGIRVAGYPAFVSSPAFGIKFPLIRELPAAHQLTQPSSEREISLGPGHQVIQFKQTLQNPVKTLVSSQNEDTPNSYLIQLTPRPEIHKSSVTRSHEYKTTVPNVMRSKGDHVLKPLTSEHFDFNDKLVTQEHKLLSQNAFDIHGP